MADGLVFAWLLDGEGAARPLDWNEVRAWKPSAGALWLHLDYTAPEAQSWLTEHSGLDPLARAALTAEDPRPRCVPHGEGLMTVLRAVNLNPGSDPEDMVSLRVWLDPHRLVTLRNRRVMAVNDVAGELEGGHGPRDSTRAFLAVLERMIDRMAEVVSDVDETVDALEDALLSEETRVLRTRAAAARRQAIALRRYLAPQRDAVGRLATDRVAVFDDGDRGRLREASDRVLRCVEDLDSARDRAAVIQEEIAAQLAEQMNQQTYVLTVVAAIFLPLGLLTGLLGINVGGIPGTESPIAFWVVCGILVGLTVFGLVWLRRLRWL